jgi:hypothetical protein
VHQGEVREELGILGEKSGGENKREKNVENLKIILKASDMGKLAKSLAEITLGNASETPANTPSVLYKTWSRHAG